MTKHLTLLLFIGLAWGQNPCDNKQYIALAKKGYQNLNDDEFDIYMDLHEKCKKYKKSQKKEESIKTKEFVIGRWKDDDPHVGGIYILKIVDGKNELEIIFNDGSVSKDFVGISNFRNKKKVTIYNNHGEYMYINNVDNVLRYYDSEGLIKTMKPIN